MIRPTMLILLLPGCAAALGQTDDFRVRLARGCSTEAECDALVATARERNNDCATNTVGQLRCRDTLPDLRTATEHKRNLQAAAERAAQEEDQAERKARQEERAAEEKRKRDREEQKVAAKERAAWLALDTAGCSDRGERDACLAISRFLYDYPESEYVDEAAAELKTGRAVMAAVEEDKRKRVDAAIQETRKPPAATPPTVYVVSPKSQASAPPVDGRVCCCDGTTSPTCTTVKRGCCSKHGGVCACD